MNKLDSPSQTPFMPTRGIIRAIVPLAQDNRLFVISCDESQSLPQCRPGQFVELWVPGVGEAPISVCSGQVGTTIELCVRRVGRVTDALFKMHEGDWVGLRGPYGQGFPLEVFKGQNLVLIAGGLGIAPIRSLWEFVLNHRENFGKITLIYGMRHSIDLLFRNEIKILLGRDDIDVYVAAEEVLGPDLPALEMQLGRVTDMIKLAILDQSYQAAICGPPVMYDYVTKELIAKGLKLENIWLSLERHMKCAFGKCGHCFVGGQFTCRDGPVFPVSQLRFIPEAIECNL